MRGVVFDKSPSANWYVTWHQDLSIPVKTRLESSGFGPWSIKDGVPHVQPPAWVLEAMLSVRIHLDDCLEEHGAVRFIPGSHQGGILERDEIERWKSKGVASLCQARKGDLILMRPLILHSSPKAQSPMHRRVLPIEYANVDLPDGIEWATA